MILHIGLLFAKTHSFDVIQSLRFCCLPFHLFLHLTPPSPLLVCVRACCFALLCEKNTSIFFPLKNHRKQYATAHEVCFFSRSIYCAPPYSSGLARMCVVYSLTNKPNRESFRHIIQCPHISNKNAIFFFFSSFIS